MEASATLVERKRREAAEELVATAIGLFERDGFEATKVEAIAATAGCSPRTFYRYFGTKEDVLFHDVPELIERLTVSLDGHLERGLKRWPALTAAVMELPERLDAGEEAISVRRMELWLREPALRARYMQHLATVETAIVETLCRRRGTDPDRDDEAQLMAIAAIGAYRTAVTTHGVSATNRLTTHLGGLLSTLAAGFTATEEGA